MDIETKISMIKELKKNEVYMWLHPQNVYGYKFKVIKIMEHSYLLRYLNYPYKIPKVDVVEISFQFMQTKMLDILRIVKA